jgi:hypothetical protein
MFIINVPPQYPNDRKRQRYVSMAKNRIHGIKPNRTFHKPAWTIRITRVDVVEIDGIELKVPNAELTNQK